LALESVPGYDAHVLLHARCKIQEASMGVQLREAVRCPERMPKRLRMYVFNRHMHQPQPDLPPSPGARGRPLLARRI